MAIRPEYRQFYGREWREYRARLIEVHGPRCSVCGAEVLKYLNLCHLEHDPQTSRVALMCPSDHARHDAAQRLAVMRRTHAKRVGQAWLWPEVEWAPYPAWQRPRSVDREAQEEMF